MKEEIVNWLNEIEKQDGIPPSEVVVFNLGLYESDEGFVMYLVGGFEYNEANDDWATLEMPKQDYRYLLLPQLVQNKPWMLVLEYAKNTLLELESEGVFNKNILQNCKAITTGFDDGELIKIR